MLLFFASLEPNILALTLLFPVIVSTLLAIAAWHPRYAPRGRVFSLLMIALTIWSAAYGLELASTTKEAMMFWLKIEYLAIPYVSVLMLLVIIQFAGLSEGIRAKNIGYFLVIPFITMVLSITNEHHFFYYTGIELNTEGDLPLLELSIGFWYYVHVIYSYLVIFYGLIILIQKLYYQRSLFRNQLLFMLLASLIPLVTFTVYFAGLMPVKNIDPTPFAFTLSGVAMSIGILKFRMLDLLPIAREHIFQSMNDGLLVIDAKNRLVDCNPVSMKIFQWKTAPYGQNISKVWNDYPDLIAISENNVSGNSEIQIKQNNESWMFLTSASEIKNHKGNFVGKLIVIHDITMRHRMQETIRQSEEKLRQLNAEKDKLFSIIAHDLRGPIGAYINLTEMFVDTKNKMTAGEMIEVGRGMNKSALALQNLLDNLLQWSRIQREEVVINKTYIYIKALAAEVIEIYKPIITKKSLHVNNIIPDDVVVIADSNMIQMILRNLVSNALKFTPKGGAILISAVVNSDHTVSIHVRDNGIGIPAQMIEHLYNFNQSTGRVGTDGEPTSGLGLKLCKEFVERNGGSIHVESSIENNTSNETTGKGTDFYITLPGRNESQH